MLVIFWIALSIFVGYAGSSKKIGFFGAFFCSLLLSPVIALLIVSGSQDKGAVDDEDEPEDE